MSNLEERRAVQVGVDLRPILITLREGEEWDFNPDPPKEFFSNITAIGKKMQVDDESRWEAVDQMRVALSEQILDEKERADFLEHNYGLAVLSGVAKAYAEQVVALPTESSSPSGRGPQTRGGSRSPAGT